jgi:hypothetical protein
MEAAPELLAIGEKLDELRHALTAASARKVEAVAEYGRYRPALPVKLIAEPHASHPDYKLSVDELDCTGRSVLRADSRGTNRTFSSRHLQARIILHDVTRGSKEGRRLRRLARIAETFETGIAAALHKSKVSEVHSEVCNLAVEINSARWPLHEMALVAMAGALAFARAYQMSKRASGECGGYDAENPLVDGFVAALFRL